jgi:hypothetical protein
MCIGFHKIRPWQLLMYHVTLHKMRYSALASSNVIRRLETRLVPVVTIFEKKLNFTHMTISFSGFIYFKCLHTSFSVLRDQTRLGLINFLTPQDIFYRYNFTHASPILCFTNLPPLFVIINL